MSIAVRDPLKARAAALALGERRAVIVSCDLIGMTEALVARIRTLVEARTGIPGTQVMVHCTHTHSGPNTGGYVGWGDEDAPYLAILPQRVAQACAGAVERLHAVTASHAVTPCEGIGLNREYDRDAPPLAECLRPDWRPAKPERTDTRCHTLRFHGAATGRLEGFMAYFGCHPVVCCQTTRYLHGDFPGVAINLLEREHPGAVGLFLQGAHGDANSCVVHKPESEALPALDIVAARFANAVRAGLRAGVPLTLDSLACVSRIFRFRSKELPRERLRALLAEQEAIIRAPDASDADYAVRMAVVCQTALAGILARLDRGKDLSNQPAELQGIRLGPVAFWGTPVEIMQAIHHHVP